MGKHFYSRKIAWECLNKRKPHRPIEARCGFLYLGIFCSVAAFMLYNYGLRTLSSSTAVALMNLGPIFGVLFSTVFLHEGLRIFDLLGGIIVILGVFLSVREKEAG
ncbi:DMT family transporter [Brevibacillus choshinensis]|uniref:DMT family transporter n=1 Tax=Brevibacillus choshinensis TaxID=54911 RepID=A0ABX7FSA2_BRECH|nr:DMT family transporter [Brevibacillus choshinensis]QRG69124.1 DMT family transporter [Brevibacillus choshinensis]